MAHARLAVALVLILATLAASPAAAAVVSISISGFVYNPITASLLVGDSAKWTNSDGVAHTATSLASPQRFDTGLVSGGGGTATVAFPTQGSYPYRCTLHASMRGAVQVGGNTPPTATIDTLPATVSGVLTISGTVPDAEGPDTWARVQVGPTQLTPTANGLGLETADGTNTWSVSWDTRSVPNGVHEIKVIGTDGVLNSAIVSAFVTVDNPLEPDLVIAQLSAQGVVAKTVTVIVRNVGNAVSPAATLQLNLLSSATDPTPESLGSATIPSLARTAQTTLTFSWDATGKVGTWTLEAIADSADVVAELREDNNRARNTAIVLVPGPAIDAFDL